MWVIDWYAFIVQHNPTPAGFKNGKGNAYETELRDDETHGRIYRVVGTKAKAEKPLTLKDATPEKLVDDVEAPQHDVAAPRRSGCWWNAGRQDVVPALDEADGRQDR